MNPHIVRAALLACLVSLTLACGSSPTGPPATVVAPVIEKDGIPFDGQAIPDELLDRLSPYRVVVV